MIYPELAPELGADSILSPTRIFSRDAADELAVLAFDGVPSAARFSPPEETKTELMPFYDRARFYDDEHRAPAMPKARQEDPEHAVGGPESRPATTFLEHRDLLPERRIFESKIEWGEPEPTPERGESGDERAHSCEITPASYAE